MGSHMDYDHIRRKQDEARRDFLKELTTRAELMSELGANREQHGTPLAEWKAEGFRCSVLPDDSMGILRISIGGGDDTPVRGDYCNVRGDVGKCITLLERALVALRKCP